ncbi:MAG: hypothetical protein UEK58_06040 [Merdibacter sp.]|nr:hypothetical protein [Merdibacter sp.]
MDTIFMDYESLLMGQRKDIGLYNFFGAEPGGANQQRALIVIRYAIEKVLGWSVEDAVLKFDDYMIREMKLERVVDFINYPTEVKSRDPRYILSLLYPSRVRMDLQQMVTDIYKDVLAHEGQFPREYFVGANGFFRYCICLQYLITHYHPVKNLDELYQFLLSSEGNRFLMNYRLKIPAEQLNINLLDCIHELTRDQEYSDLYYSYYSLQIQQIQECL